MELPVDSAVEAEFESVEEIVSHLPSAQSLPDGFSVSENFPDVCTSTASESAAERSRENVSKSSIMGEGSRDPLVVNTNGLQQLSGSSILAGQSELGFRSPMPATDRGLKFASDMPEIGVGHSPEQIEGKSSLLPDLTDFSVDLTANLPTTVVKSAEKPRRFPVLLSDGDSSPSGDIQPESQKDRLRGPLFSGFEASNNENNGNGKASEMDAESGTDSDGDDSDRPSSSETNKHLTTASLQRNVNPDEPLQDILESKIAELEVAVTGSSKTDDEESKRARARKRQMKEVRAMLDGTEKSFDEKLRLLNSKYLQQVSETKQLEKELLTLRRKCEQVNKEKDTIYGEYTKVSALRQKLESLCRELQRQNKMLLDDSKRMSAEEQNKRQELSTKFHNTIKDITSKLEEQGDERLQQIRENEILRDKLKLLTQQYEKRDQHLNHQLKTKELEQQLAEMKLKQQQELTVQEQTKSSLYNEKLTLKLKIEQDLRAQLAHYGDKFEQFQETLTKSNEVFATFKKEMEKMTKTIKRLEKENLTLKKKSEKSDVTIIDLLDERVSLKKQVETFKNQKEKLEALCRSLQAERKSSTPIALPSQDSLQDAMSAGDLQA